MPTFASVSSRGSPALPAVAPVVAQWAHDDPWQLVAETASRKDLALLASTLWACAPPPGADFGLGLVVAFDAFERRDRGDVQSAVVHDREIAGLKEALRRANDARQTAEAAAARTAQELRDERRARRTREENAEAETQAAYRHAEGVESQLRQSETELESERARVGREQQRARAFEEDLRKARAELADLTTEMQQTPSRLDSRDARRARRCHRRDATARGEARIVPRARRDVERDTAASPASPAGHCHARRAAPDRVRPRR